MSIFSIVVILLFSAWFFIHLQICKIWKDEMIRRVGGKK
jgi:hypothetical protein